MPRRKSIKARGIGNAAIEGAREANEQSQPLDAKVNPEHGPERSTENNEAPLGGAPVAFPAPSAQPTRDTPQQQTQRPANVDSAWTNDEDEEAQWRRAGGKRAPGD
jgi:hypothetical protein